MIDCNPVKWLKLTFPSVRSQSFCSVDTPKSRFSGFVGKNSIVSAKGCHTVPYVGRFLFLCDWCARQETRSEAILTLVFWSKCPYRSRWFFFRRWLWLVSSTCRSATGKWRGRQLCYRRISRTIWTVPATVSPCRSTDVMATPASRRHRWPRHWPSLLKRALR